MNYVIGDAIRNKIVEKGTTFKAFADKFGISDRNLQHVFKKNDLPISQILRASEILDYDFLYEYAKAKKPKYKIKQEDERVVDESEVKYSAVKKHLMTMNFSLNIAGSEDQFEKFPELLKQTRKFANDLGFEVL